MSHPLLRAGTLALAATLAIAPVSVAVPAQAQSSLVDPVQLPQGSSALAADAGSSTATTPGTAGQAPQAAPGAASAAAAADSAPATQKTGAYVAGLHHQEGNWYLLDVYSPAMQRVIRNNLLLAPGGLENTAPRPTLYLLQGSEGGQNGDDWPHKTGYRGYFADKNVNVVSAIGGEGSLFLDWPHPDLSLGNSQWMTYYGEELPEIMESVYHSDGRRVIAGMSMAGGAALNMAARYPGRFRAAASLSGYTSLTSPLGRAVAYSMAAAHLARLSNALGLPDDPRWALNDPALNLEALRGVPLFLSSGGSLPAGPEVLLEPTAWEGMAAEIPARALTDAFVRRARQAGLQVTYSRDLNGLHYWPYFEQSLYKAWETTLGPALGNVAS